MTGRPARKPAEQPAPRVEPVTFPPAPMCADFRERTGDEKCAISWCGRCRP